jgi:hypothetical protein
MAGIDFIHHRGRRVLLLDFCGVGDAARALKLMAEARALVTAQPRDRTLLTVVDVQGMTVDNQVLKGFGDLAAHNAPWVLASAVCNATQLGRVMARANGVMTRRTFALCDSRAAALDYVVEEAAKASAAAKPPA